MSDESFIIIKSVGHSPEDLVRLHRLLGSSKVRSTVPLDGYVVDYQTGSPNFSHSGVASIPDAEKFPYAELLSSDFDKKFDTYTVEVRVWLSRRAKGYSPTAGSDHHFGDAPCPISVPLEVFKVLGVFPRTPTIIPKKK